MSRAVVGNYM